MMQLSAKTKKHKKICKKLITINNPDNDSYCVMSYSENAKTLKLMSWHDARPEYGDEQWELKYPKK
ncbi:MAG: hypothetical protein IKD09_03605 [Lentisphaeria bacterium]|nr:hypothetical protein [Lentisphaeria bacterium]